MPPRWRRAREGWPAGGLGPSTPASRHPQETRAAAPGEPARLNDKPQRKGARGSRRPGGSAVPCPAGSAQPDPNLVLGHAGIQPAELSQALPGPPAPPQHARPQPCPTLHSSQVAPWVLRLFLIYHFNYISFRVFLGTTVFCFDSFSSLSPPSVKSLEQAPGKWLATVIYGRYQSRKHQSERAALRLVQDTSRPA